MGCIAYIDVEGVTGGFERVSWDLSMSQKGVVMTADSLDIAEDGTEILVLIYSERVGAPYFFHTMEHQFEDNPKYRIEPNKNYEVELLVVDRKRRERSWRISVEVSPEGGIGVYNKEDVM